MKHSTILALLLLGACSDRNPDQPGGAAGDSSAVACEDEQTAFLDLVAEHRSCSVDEDCTVYGSLCLYEGTVGCGYVYVADSLEQATFDDSEATLQSCRNASGQQCGACTGGPAPPVCTDGICAPCSVQECFEG